MTDLHHPITPPPELVEQWDSECESDVDAAMYLATQAARWGANQELEACCEWLDSKGSPNASRLRAARRPKPPSITNHHDSRTSQFCQRQAFATANRVP
jgi:hypothetical protein